jgi:phage portal protein BeeE
MTQQKRIVDQYGREMTRPNETITDSTSGMKAYLRSFASANSFLFDTLRSSGSLDHKIRNPYSTHPWVFAAAATLAKVASQAPLKIFSETRASVDLRRVRAKEMGRSFSPNRGKRRSAMKRYSELPAGKRAVLRSLEEDFDHPLNSLLWNPCPHLDMSQLIFVTFLLLTLEGEVFWVYTNTAGEVAMIGEEIESIWVVPGRHFKPIQEVLTSHGELVGWEMSPPKFLPAVLSQRSQVILNLNEVTQFKSVDPYNQFRGHSPLIAIAAEVESDIRQGELDRAFLKNRGVPGGILSTDGVLSPEQWKEIRSMWKELHEGEANVHRIALLHSGLKWQDVQQSSAESRDVEKRDSNRRTELAAIGVPESVLGVSDAQNYATQLGQDRNFWDKTLVPLMRILESGLDRSRLMFQEPDTHMILFDLGDIEALRAGLDLKIDSALKLTGPGLHMSPAAALEVVGLDAPDYEGKDVCLVPTMLLPVADVLEGLGALDLETEGEEGESQSVPSSVPEVGEFSISNPLSSEVETPPPATPPSAVGDGVKSFYTPNRNARKNRAAGVLRSFAVAQNVAERKFRPKHKSWALKHQAEVLERFDDSNIGKSLKGSSKLEAILPSAEELSGSLAEITRPLYLAITELTYDFSLPEIGVPVFGIDDARIAAFWEKRQRLFSKSVGKATFKRLMKTMTIGIRQGETHAQIRNRIREAFQQEISTSRVRTIARTETAGLMNGVRREMFTLQEFQRSSWTTALDENVRPDHVTYGQAGPRPLEFNYLSLVGRENEGTLSHPNDTRGPAAQVINCRCVEVPEA